MFLLEIFEMVFKPVIVFNLASPTITIPPFMVIRFIKVTFGCSVVFI